MACLGARTAWPVSIVLGRYWRVTRVRSFLARAMGVVRVMSATSYNGWNEFKFKMCPTLLPSFPLSPHHALGHKLAAWSQSHSLLYS